MAYRVAQPRQAPWLTPLRVFMAFFNGAVILLAVVLVGALVYAAVNYFRPPSQQALVNLAHGTVTVRASDAEGTGGIVRIGGAWEVITAAHVVGSSRVVDVVGTDGSIQRAPVKWADAQRDVAVLDVKPGPQWVALAIDTGTPRPTDKLLTRCFFDDHARQGPYLGPVDVTHVGTEHLQTQLDLGQLVSNLRGGTVSGANVAALMPVQPGCSGAPLLNASGQMVGIVLAGNGRETIGIAAGGSIPGVN